MLNWKFNLFSFLKRAMCWEIDVNGTESRKKLASEEETFRDGKRSRNFPWETGKPTFPENSCEIEKFTFVEGFEDYFQLNFHEICLKVEWRGKFGKACRKLFRAHALRFNRYRRGKTTKKSRGKLSPGCTWNRSNRNLSTISQAEITFFSFCTVCNNRRLFLYLLFILRSMGNGLINYSNIISIRLAFVLIIIQFWSGEMKFLFIFIYF